MAKFMALFKLTDQGVMALGRQPMNRALVEAAEINFINFFATPLARYDGVGVFECEGFAEAVHKTLILRKAGNLEVEIIPAFNYEETTALFDAASAQQ